MALAIYDRVLQTGTANTTVSFNLSGSVTGFQSFSVVGNGNTTYYAATDGTNWETGLGTYNSTGPVLTRTTVSQSSNSNTAVTFSGTVTVWVDYPSSFSVYQGGPLGTPSSGVATNLTGTASGLSIGGSAPAASLTGTALPSAIVSSSLTSVGSLGNTQIASLGVGTAASGTSGEIRATNNVTAYYSSDRTLKENIKPISAALQKVEYIGGKTFSWTQKYIDSHGGEDGYFVTKEDFGVIAQDVQSVFPVAVKTRQDGTLAVDYPKLVSLAFAAIAELKAEVDALKGK